ncbi:MAG: hypothetical protein JSV33_04890 [bacterium]|nr:MAG: hypothetical protein JSV33_04890 [bacterium]
MLRIRFFTLSFLIFLAGPCMAASDSHPDSIGHFRWSFLYQNRIELARRSEPFPWNDREESSHISDRAAVLVEYVPSLSFRIFCKGATGIRKIEDGVPGNRFILEQGHVCATTRSGSLAGRIFLKERVFRTDHKLLYFISNDSRNVGRGGEGIRIAAGYGRRFGLLYTESVLRSEESYKKYGGFSPLDGGGDIFRFLRLTLGLGGVRTGMLLSEIRSQRLGDMVAVGTDLDIRIRRITLVAELARMQPGAWSDLEKGVLFGIDPRKFRPNRVSAVFSGKTVFAAEAAGLEIGNSSLGTVGLIPGYRYIGREFVDRVGELPDGVIETSLTSWWRHPVYDLFSMLEAVRRYRYEDGVDRDHLRGLIRARLRGGFEVENGVLVREHDKPSCFLSLLDENKLTRLAATARLDDLGGKNDLSFLVTGSMNFARSFSFRSTLYLYRSVESYYNVACEYRPGPRFLCVISAGSYVPLDEGLQLRHEFEHEPPLRERRVSVLARIWFGEI